jgi:hypothetical protein
MRAGAFEEAGHAMTAGPTPGSPSDMQRLREDLSQLMQSNSMREARDRVAANPLLAGTEVATYLDESIKRLRQRGETELAKRCEFWLVRLREFRERGAEAAYLEMAIDELARARSPEDHRRVLSTYPELKDAATQTYLAERLQASDKVADVDAGSKYRLVQHLTQAAGFDGPAAEQADMSDTINVFTHGFVLAADVANQRRLLEARPDLLGLPLAVLVGAMFGPFIERARARNDLVKLRELLLREALFARCREVGPEQAFAELENGVTWPRLSRTGGR